jgi:hypothetical protein
MRILKGLSSRLLACGCITGVYETYEGEIVTIIDAHGRSCPERAHADGNIVPLTVNVTSRESMAARD